MTTLRSILAFTSLTLGFLVIGTAAAAPATATLKVTFWPHGRGAGATIWTLKCSPPGGTHPARRLACAALNRHPADLRPATRACTLMPTRTSAQARITGTWGGHKVERTYRIGCPGWADLRVALTGR